VKGYVVNEYRFAAEAIGTIHSHNVNSVGQLIDGDEVVVQVPDGIECEIELNEEKRTLLIKSKGQSKSIEGGVTIKAGVMSGNVTAQTVRVLQPRGYRFNTKNTHS